MGDPRLTTILFDLDGTLLDLRMESFLGPYFSALAVRLAPFVEPETLVGALMDATRAMMRDPDPGCSNQEVFWEDFLPRVGGDLERLLPVIQDFYAYDFPRLSEHSRRRPEAREVVSWCFEQGLQVAIATNPVFPAAAIHERLRWAGVDDFPYALVTTYEDMHFCKPNPDYYREVLGLLEAQPQSTVMVGNDAELDMVAGSVGIVTYLVDDPSVFDDRPVAAALAEASSDGAAAPAGPDPGKTAPTRLSPGPDADTENEPNYRGRLAQLPQTLSKLI